MRLFDNFIHLREKVRTPTLEFFLSYTNAGSCNWGILDCDRAVCVAPLHPKLFAHLPMSRVHKGVEWSIRELRDQSSLRRKPNGGIRREMQTRECTAGYTSRGYRKIALRLGGRYVAPNAVNNSLANLCRCFNAMTIRLRRETYPSPIYVCILILHLLVEEIPDVLHRETFKCHK